MPTHNPHRVHQAAVTRWTTHHPEDALSQPYIAAERSLLNGSTLAARRPGRWIDALHRFEDFTRTHGHTPRENTRDRATLPAAERRLGEWARYQRRFEERLCNFQIIRLDLSTAFTWDPHENAWAVTLHACTHFFHNNGRLPTLNGKDPEEFALARWLGRQLRQQRDGMAAAGRVERLEKLLRLPLECAAV